MALHPHPKPWTHHHTHRLYHLSVAWCFGLAALAMVGMMGSYWAQVQANPLSNDLEITATVEGVSPGPIVVDRSSGSKPKPKVTANPTITIFAEPQGRVPLQGATYIFTTTRPEFSGNTSVANGLIFVTVRGAMELNSTALADAQGKWYWKSPVNLINGAYTIRVAVFDSYDLTRSGFAAVSFMVNAPPAEQPQQPGAPAGPTPTVPGPTSPGPGSGPSPAQPTPPAVPPTAPPTSQLEPLPPVPPIDPGVEFGVFFSMLDNSKYITAGSDAVGAITLVSRSVNAVTDQDIHYKVTNPEGRVILESTDTVTFSQTSQYLKTFLTAPGTPTGDYTVTVTSTYNGVTSVASDSFRIISSTAVGGTTGAIYKQGPIIIWSLLFLLWLLFIIIVIIAYRRIKHHTEQLRLLPGGPFGDQQQSRVN